MTLTASHRSGVHRAFVAAVFVLGLAALGDSLLSLHRSPVSYLWLGLAVLTIASDYAGAFEIPGLKSHVSFTEIFLFLLVLLFGGAPAVATVSISGLVIALRQGCRGKRREDRGKKAAFDMGEPALSMWVAAHVYLWSGGLATIKAGEASLVALAAPTLAMTATYFILNGGLNALAVAGVTGQSPLPLWRKYLRDLSVNYFSNASIAVVIAVTLASGSVIDVVKALAVIAPLVIAPYLSLWQSKKKLEADQQHLEEKDKLEGELVETLGMTAEAQDPVKSLGHIRRVQKFAVKLAGHLGITDEAELRAISYAGLLHDYGKTKLPRHILDKPGSLTPAEYEIVKTHTSMGADMISRIPFKLPLAPLIRHHHENWDGTGYPDGIRGEAIPIGARILSVVDCYDALRERRRYRPAKTHDEAMAIVRERAGTMYDPDVVRALESIQDAVRYEPYEDAGAEPAEVAPVTSSQAAPAQESTTPLPIELRLSDTETLIQLHEALSRLEAGAGVTDTCELVTRHLLKIAPAGLVVFYRRDEQADEMAAVYASGFGEALARGTRMRIGEKVTGWVGAYGQPVINQDSVLDLDERMSGIEPQFRSLLSVPLKLSGTTAGVVTLYALRRRAFRDEQLQLIELIAGEVAAAFDRAVRADAAPRQMQAETTAPGPAGAGGLAELLATDSGGEHGRTRAVLCLKNEGDAGTMLHATMALSKATRVADLIARPSDDSLVVLMRDSDPAAGALVIQRIAAALPPDVAPPTDPDSVLRVGFACSPQDGVRWRDLLAVAQHRSGNATRDLPAAPPSPAVVEHGGESCRV